MSVDERDRQRAFETRFLQQVRKRAEMLIGSKIPGKGLEIMSMPDGLDYVRATLKRLDVENPRQLLDSLPGTRAIQIGVRRGLVGAMRGTPKQRLRAQMIAPVEMLVRDGSGDPIGREQVLDALARYEILPARAKPTIAILGSAQGFTDAAKMLVNQAGPPRVVLVGGRGDGGWDIDMSGAMRQSVWAQLFDFESADERLDRLQYHLQENINLLESRGLSFAELSEKLGLPRAEVEKLVHRACRDDSRLMTVKHNGEVALCRSPMAGEGRSMGMWSTIKRWLGFKPSVKERVDEMTKQRVQLEQQRSNIDGTIDRLESEERTSIQAGAAAKSMAEKKQLAAKLIRVRRELKRHRAQAQVLTNQIEILGTHIHHLTLKETGKRMQLPDAEELAQEAAQAEQVMTELEANADLAHSIEVGDMSPTMEAEEADILAEFEQIAAAETPVAEPASGTTESVGTEAAGIPEPPLPADRSRGGSKERPEAG